MTLVALSPEALVRRVSTGSGGGSVAAPATSPATPPARAAALTAPRAATRGGVTTGPSTSRVRQGPRRSRSARGRDRALLAERFRWLRTPFAQLVVHDGDREAHRAVRVFPGPARVGIVLGDDRPTWVSRAPSADDLPGGVSPGSVVVWAHADGRVRVDAGWAPPALLVTCGGWSMLPQVPGPCAEARLQPGDRLVVLAPAAFEDAPDALARLIHEADATTSYPAVAEEHDHVRRRDGAALLATLLQHAPAAGGAVLTFAAT